MRAFADLKSRVGIPESQERHKAYLILADFTGRPFVPPGKEKYEAALALAPDSAALHHAYASTLLLGQNYSGAEIEEKRSLELWPEDAEAHYGLAAALMGQNRDDEAILEAREALRIYPPDKGAQVALGMALTRDRQYKDAVPVLREAITKTPSMILLHKDLGLSLFNTGDIEGAVSEYVLYLQTYPDDAEVHYGLGVVFRSQGHKEDAQAQFREAVRLAPTNPVFSAAANPSAADNGPESVDGQRPDDGSVDSNIYINRFFQFSFEFPEDWTVMGADAQRTMVKVGSQMLAGGDQTFGDLEQAAAAHAYPLLYVTPGKSSAQGYSTRSIQISALDLKVDPSIISGEDFLKSTAKFLQKLQTPLQATGAPMQISVGGRHLWRMDMAIRVNDSLNHASEIATIEKGYMLLFVLSSPDQAGLDELLQDMNSLRFLQNSNLQP
jgi:Flp pilus assembly protein TadD